ncbi:hypothetical protein CmeUKMEL1_17255 [Cryptosporidium meleagridis]|uniref:ThiF family protein n=1 Tax=Cryptosporidium meleagridis TaxID=93969 RepID=A0A2P4Z5R4_9CRYT|nr:hypothetical protein CmeUKMEL1_17255 [Cryptosporidium meleagridis]
MDQLRSRERLIWGAVGEEALKYSKILILGSTSILTSELAISLASSGIGEIVFVDCQVATEEDYGSCLCLDGEKAKIVNQPKIYLFKDFLLSLHVNIKIECVLESPEKYLETLMNEPLNSNTLEYSAVVCCNLPGNIVEIVYNLAKSGQGITSCFIISLKSRGEIGQYQVFSTNQTYVTFDLSAESKNLAKLYGLQLFNPIESLISLASEINIKKLEENSSGLNDFLSKIPFPILLVYIGLNAGLFRGSEFGMDRENLKKKFKQSLEQILKDYDFPNYLEAKRYQYLLFSDPVDLLEDQIFQFLESQKLFSIFNDWFSLNKRSFSTINVKYQIVLSWIYNFLNDFGRLPVNKELPEMYCETVSYLQLQKIFHEQFTLDVSRVSKSNTGKIDISNSDFNLNISDELVQFVCSHLYCLRFIEFKNTPFRWGEIQKKITNVNPALKERLLQVFLEDKSQDSHLIEFLFLDFLDYIHIDKGLIEDSEEIKTSFQNYLKSLRLEHIQIPPDFIQSFEIKEKFVTSSYISGVCSQEIIKLVMGRFVPLNNLLIWK